jgi:hypothetical protein
MSYLYPTHPVTEDRDLSRAAAERSLMLQALSERQAAVEISPPRRIVTRLLRRRMLRRTAPRRVTAAEPAAASMVR